MNVEPQAQTESEREIVVSRVIAAPRELIWKVWTDPTHVTRWWGPHGFSTTTSEFALKPGGIWRFVMHGPDGVDYPNRIQYEDIEEPNYLYYKHAGEGEFEDVAFEAVVTFEDVSGQTKVTLRTIFPTMRERETAVQKRGAIEGARNTLERFDRVVQELITGRKLELNFRSDTEAELTRMFDAPRELVWKAWTEPSHMQQWMTGPDGWTMEVVLNDFMPGGAWRYVWHKSGGAEMEILGTFKEIVPMSKLVTTESWGKPWPETVNHVEFTELNGRTKMTMRIVYPSKAARDAALQTGMTDGMEVSLERLERLLSVLQ